MKNLIIFALVGGGLLLFTSKKKFVKTAQFSFKKLQLDWKKKKIFVTLTVANPTAQSLMINTVLGNLIVSGKTLATIQSFTPTKIVAKGESDLKLDLKPSGLGLLSMLKDLITTKGKDIKKLAAKFVGSANVEGVTIPINTALG